MLFINQLSSFLLVIRLLILAIFWTSFAVFEANAQSSNVLRVGTDGAYPPYNATTPSGELVGFEIDLIGDLCDRMERKCEFVVVDWTGMIPKLQEGTVDVIMSALSIRPERRKVIDFSLPYFSAPTYFVARRGTPITNFAGPERITLAELSTEEAMTMNKLGQHLAGAIIGVEGSTTHEDFVREYVPNAGRIRIYPKQESLFLDLVIGRVDAALVGYVTIRTFIEEERQRGRAFETFGPGFTGGVLGSGVAFGLRKDVDGLRQDLDQALLSAKRDGTLPGLSEEWFGFDGTISYDDDTGVAE